MADDEKLTIRSIAPFSDLKDPTNTIYDHLPYVKDITLEGIDKIQDESGNVVKRWNIDENDKRVINTNKLQAKLIEENAAKDEMMRSGLSDRTPSEAMDQTSAVDESSGEPVAAEEIQPAASSGSDTSLLTASEEDDDFSFLND